MGHIVTWAMPRGSSALHCASSKQTPPFCSYMLKSVFAKGVGPGPTLAWPGWKQPDIPVEVDTGRLETDVGMQEF